MTSAAVLLEALVNDCRYLCQQWQSTGLDILATLSAFLMGLVLTRALDPKDMPLNNWVKTGVWVTALFVFATVLVISPLADATPNSFAVFLWALWLPVVGVIIKRCWPWLF